MTKATNKLKQMEKSALKDLQKKKATVQKVQEAFSKYEDMQKIGMDIPINPYNMVDNERCLPIKFKPPKIPAKSKKIYKGVFIRSMKPFFGLYDVGTGIYIVSIQDDKDVNLWIDKNENKIKERLKWIQEF